VVGLRRRRRNRLRKVASIQHLPFQTLCDECVFVWVSGVSTWRWRFHGVVSPKLGVSASLQNHVEARSPISLWVQSSINGSAYRHVDNSFERSSSRPLQFAQWDIEDVVSL